MILAWRSFVFKEQYPNTPPIPLPPPKKKKNVIYFKSKWDKSFAHLAQKKKILKADSPLT